MGIFDARVNRIQVSYGGFKMLLSMCPNHDEDVIDEPSPNERLVAQIYPYPRIDWRWKVPCGFP